MDRAATPPPPPAPVIRPRETADLGACVRVLADVHARDGYPRNWPTDPGGWLAPRSLLAAWVAELDGRVVGHTGLSRGTSDDAAAVLWAGRMDRAVEDTAVVSRLFVSPTARGHGLGALLLAEATAGARARGRHPVLDVLSSDTSAAALYDRAGWDLLAGVEADWGPRETVTLLCYAAPSA